MERLNDLQINLNLFHFLLIFISSFIHVFMKEFCLIDMNEAVSLVRRKPCFYYYQSKIPTNS